MALALPLKINGKYLPEGLFHLIEFQESLAELENEVGWTLPGVNGLALRQYWGLEIQPDDENHYDWSLMDAALAMAAKRNRRISVLIGMGVFCPPWLMKNHSVTFFNSTGVVLTDTGDMVAGETAIRGLSNVFSAGYYVGAGISGTGIPAGAYIVQLISSVAVGISVPLTQTLASVPITVTDRYPAPWDTVYQGHLSTFIQTMGERYDSDPNLAYVTIDGFGRKTSMAFCETLNDNLTLATTTYGGVTGNQLWLNGFIEVGNLWRRFFKRTTLMVNYFGVQFPQVDALAIQATVEFQKVAGSQFGIKWNNANPSLGPHEQVPYAFMKANSSINPAALQPQRAIAVNYPGEIVSAKKNLIWFYEFYGNQLTANRSALVADNAYFINYVNGLPLWLKGRLLPVDLTVSAAPFGSGGNLPYFAQLFDTSLSGLVDPNFLIGKTYGTKPTHDIGPFFDGDEWWYFDPLTGQYQPGEQGCPIGTIALWAGGGDVPARWLGCTGLPVSRRTFARLFQAIGETWGPGDGQSTFNLPPAGKIYISAAGFVALQQVPIDAPPNAPSNLVQQGLGGSEAQGNEPISPNQLVAYPNSGVGARGGGSNSRTLIPTDMPGLNPFENAGLETGLRVQIANFNNAEPPSIPGVNIPNIQPSGAGNNDGVFSYNVVDIHGNNIGANPTPLPILPPYVAIAHMIKYQ